ncbi:MAG TPA: hypothetical protein EYF95_05160 [Flavobacteriales bacterium]|nr:hypothetical protein [Flavobacteriales bacterium]
MDEEPIAQSLDLDTALQQFSDNNQEPDGFLLRLVVFDDEETDISPLTVSIEGFCLTHDLQYRRDLITDQQGRNYTVLDIVGMVGFKNLSATLKKCDEILGVIIKSAMGMGLQQPSQAVHFLWTSLEEE